MDLNANPAEVFALITAGTLFVIAVLKKLIPKWMDGKEEVFSMVLPVAFVVVAKLLKAFNPDISWVAALLWALGGGITAGASWDYAVKPILKKWFPFLLENKNGKNGKDGGSGGAAPAEPPKPAEQPK